MKKENRELIFNIFTILIALFGAVTGGLAYMSQEQSKRGDLSLFINDNYVDITVNSTPEIDTLTFSVNCSLANEGSRSIQINSVSLYIALPIPTAIVEKNSTATRPSFTGYEISYDRSNLGSLGLSDRYLEPEKMRTFSISNQIRTDSHYFQNLEYAQASIRINYFDGIGNQVKDVPINVDWNSYSTSRLGAGGVISVP
jgi:hypothetical protein